MTTNTTIPPTTETTKERKSRRKTIFSLMGITLLMTCLFVGFAYGAVNNGAPGCDSPKDTTPSKHIISCNSADGTELGWLLTDCPFCGENGFDAVKDLESCQEVFGTEATQTDRMTPCGIKPVENPPQV